MIRGNYELFEGRLDEAAELVPASRRRGRRRSGAAPAGRRGTRAARPGLRRRPDGRRRRPRRCWPRSATRRTPYAAYAWYCAGEADLAVDVERARVRFARALELAELTSASFVTGVAGASKASIDARLGDPRRRRRGLPAADHPLAPGRDVVDAVDDAALDRRAAGPARATRGRGRAGGRGAGDARRAPHLRRRRGRAGRARRAAAGRRSATRPTRRRSAEGAALDGDAAVEHALRALTPVAERLAGGVAVVTTAAARRGCRAPTCRPSRG